MDVKYPVWIACLASLAGGLHATEFKMSDTRAVIAPTSVQLASCNGCDQPVCDKSQCDSAICCDDNSCDSGLFGLRGKKAACCDTSGCDGCSLANECNDGLLGFGIIKHSDACFNDFISPMTNPVFFEDPRNLTEARFIALSHDLPGALGGNSIQVYALQLRAAITDRLSIIATKDGLIYTQSPILQSGYADLAAGLKYNLYRDAACGRLLSTGVTLEMPTGSNRSLQGNGNSEFHFFTTGGTRVGSHGHWLSAAGLRAPCDDSLENRLFYWSNHFDVRLGCRPIYAFTEVNWYNYLSSGNAFQLPLEGGDLFNLGSTGITGNDLVTQGVGLKAKPRQNIEAGVCYEFPLTERKGLLENRVTADLIFRY